MTTQHTQGRLIVTSRYTICTEDGETPVASTCLIDSVSENDGANARRLVACWNACEGISTESLEKYAQILEHPFKDLFLAMEESELELMDQRNELLEALKEIATTFSGGNKFQKIARAAIAKVEGKS